MLGVPTAAPCALLLKLVVREAIAGGFLVGECDVVGGLGVAELPSLGHVAAEGGYLVFLELVFDALGVVSRPTAVAICGSLPRGWLRVGVGRGLVNAGPKLTPYCPQGVNIRPASTTRPKTSAVKPSRRHDGRQRRPRAAGGTSGSGRCGDMPEGLGLEFLSGFDVGFGFPFSF